MSHARLPRPFELAVTLNPTVEPAAVATFPTQDEANAAVEAEAARYAARYGVLERRESTDKRNYRRIRLRLAPDAAGVGGVVEIVARRVVSELVDTPR